jgi:hypothetical protein
MGLDADTRGNGYDERGTGETRYAGRNAHSYQARDSQRGNDLGPDGNHADKKGQ